MDTQNNQVDFELLFNHVPDRYLVLDRDLRIVYGSPSYLKATNTQLSSVKNKIIFDVFPDNPDDPNATGVKNLRSSLERVISSKKPDTMAVQKYDIPITDGEVTFFAERYWSPLNTPVFDKNGDVVYVIHRVEDVTELANLKETELEMNKREHQLEAEIIRRGSELQAANEALRQANSHTTQQLLESEERFRLIAENVPVLIWTADATGRIDYCNKRWCDFLGADNKGILDESWMQVVHPEDFGKTAHEWPRAVKAGTAYEAEFRLKRLSDDEYRWFLARATPIMNSAGQIIKWFGSNIDIHDLKQARMELEKAQTDLIEANLAKSQFMANMSHEIRTPLGVIIGFAELALDAEKAHADAHDYLLAIKRNGQQLTHIIGEVLDLSKAESNKLDVVETQVPLASFLNEIITSVQPQAEGKGINVALVLDQSVPDLIETDPNRLRQALTNLISNAVKFTGRGEVKLYVRMTSPKLEGQPIRMEFKVTDTGIGISHSHQIKLFHPFSQVDSSMTRQYGGTGLGLLLTKQMALAMGGDLKLDTSSPGKGSTFILTIEAGLWQKNVLVTDEALARKIIPLHPEADLKGCRILLVEDSPDNQILVSHYLMNTGATVEIANNGFEGVEKASHNTYDIILMDIQMPVMDGYQATKYIRQNGFNKPIIALTAHALRQEQQRALNSGFNVFLTKPISKQVLIDNLARAV